MREDLYGSLILTRVFGPAMLGIVVGPGKKNDERDKVECLIHVIFTNGLKIDGWLVPRNPADDEAYGFKVVSK